MPAQGSKRINKALTNLSVFYDNADYIAGNVLRDINVKKESDKYYIYTSEKRVPDAKRANGSPANMYTWEVSTSSYNVYERALKDVNTDRDYMNVEAPINLDRDTVENLTDKINLNFEMDAMKLLFTTTTFSNNTTLTTATSWDYNATTTSAPIQNVLSATGAMLKASGKMPNEMVIGWAVLEALKENNNVYGRIQYVERAIITEELLASLFDLNKVHVGKAVYDSALEGGTESQGLIWGTDALVAYFVPNPGLKKATAAANFRVSQYGSPWKVKKWRDEEVEGNYVEVQTMYEPKAIATACAHLFKTVTLI